MTILFFTGVLHVYCAKFRVIVSNNCNPIIKLLRYTIKYTKINLNNDLNQNVKNEQLTAAE